MAKFEINTNVSINRTKLVEVGLYELGDQAPRRTVMVKAEPTFESVMARFKETGFNLDGYNGIRILNNKEICMCQDVKGIFPDPKLFLVNISIVNGKEKRKIPALTFDNGILKRASDDPTAPDYNKCLRIQDVVAWDQLKLANKTSRWFKVPEDAENACEAHLQRIKPVLGVI